MTEDKIAELVARGDAEALARLAESADKAIAKAARRGLHHLRTRGVKVAAAPVARERTRTPEARPAAAEVPCLASSIDGSGERAIWLARAEPGAGGVSIYEAYVHEQNGLTGFRVSEATRKSFRQLVRELLGESKQFSVAEVPWRWARAEIEEAYRRNLSVGRAAPVDFLRVRPQLGKAEPLAEHPALELWPQAPEVPREAGLRLHELPECRPWVPDPIEIERVALKLGEVDQSQLLVNDQQKAAARADVMARAVREYFADAGRRERMRRRLLDTAHLLALAGPARAEDARAARAVADHFAPGASPEDSPFAQRLFEKCFRLPSSAEVTAEPRPAGGGLIVPP
ncbi:MAG TPA: hypothetical protein VKN99_11810 [Polyangia bacterium]|nr:hypothetical protein [Polyangia bacterium]